jgi:hypothetical protein
MTHYTVTTPTYLIHWQDEPPEECWDWVSVDAASKREAKVKAVARWREKPRHWQWVSDRDRSGESPFRGLKVSEPLCEHGACWCDICADDPNWTECLQCMAEWEAEAPR